MPKTADEKFEAMVRAMKQWRLLCVLLGFLLVLSQRSRLGRWIDTAEGWFQNVAQASAEPVRDER